MLAAPRCRRWTSLILMVLTHAYGWISDLFTLRCIILRLHFVWSLLPFTCQDLLHTGFKITS
jgi:hypothetical protein